MGRLEVPSPGNPWGWGGPRCLALGSGGALLPRAFGLLKASSSGLRWGSPKPGLHTLSPTKTLITGGGE